MRLSEHFTLEELVVSQTAARNGWDNTPSREVRDNLTFLVIALEAARHLLHDAPIHISSGYRSEVLNNAVGGSPSSAHIKGLAADFIAPHFGTPYQIIKHLTKQNFVFDQLIHEYRCWVHLGVAPHNYTPRKEVLSIFPGSRYIAGLHDYPPEDMA